MNFLKMVTDVGFPIASALAGGFFVFLTLRFILDGVLSDIKTQRGFAKSLDNRVKTMNNELVRVDVLMCQAFGVTPDVDRIARADGQKDARKD
jgi:archaellum biogenesis ATPase FlaH